MLMKVYIYVYSLTKKKFAFTYKKKMFLWQLFNYSITFFERKNNLAT